MFEESLKGMRVPSSSTREAAWTKLQQRIDLDAQPQVVHIHRRSFPAWAAAAAVLVLVVGALSLLSIGDVESGSFAATYHERVVLPDGSEVRLTPGSKLKYSFEDDGERTLHLKGEAFFEVTKGQRFVVNTDAGIVEVLGTSFTVFADADLFAVECVTGIVAVSAGESRQQLTAGLAVKKRNGALCDPYAHTSSKEVLASGTRSYTNADLLRVFQHVEQHFGITVRLDSDLTGKEFSGSFEMRDAESALRIIALAMNLGLTKVDASTYTVQATD